MKAKYKVLRDFSLQKMDQNVKTQLLPKCKHLEANGVHYTIQQK